MTVERDERGRTWEEFVAGWIINDQKWCKRVRPDGARLGLALRAQFLGILSREQVKAHCQ